jgi:hypothetical protein
LLSYGSRLKFLYITFNLDNRKSRVHRVAPQRIQKSATIQTDEIPVISSAIQKDEKSSVSNQNFTFYCFTKTFYEYRFETPRIVSSRGGNRQRLCNNIQSLLYLNVSNYDAVYAVL